MFLKICLIVAFFTLYISLCICYVSYNQFHGFGDAYETILYGVSERPVQGTTHRRPGSLSRPRVHRGSSTITPMSPTNPVKHTVSPTESTTASSTQASSPTSPLVLPIAYTNFNCSENERPFNIGTYEVPTQRDLVLQIQKTLKRMFSQYRDKALFLLQDIQQATRATVDIEKKCLLNQHNHRKNYKKCVTDVSKKCEFITKSLVTSLERQRADVSAFVEGTICNVTEMKSDPVQLIKMLAMEQASLEFALPGFLRLLGSCSALCDHKHPKLKTKYKKPLRHMTDQDLVVKHFLTNKSYFQLIN